MPFAVTVMLKLTKTRFVELILKTEVIECFSILFQQKTEVITAANGSLLEQRNEPILSS